MIFSEYMPSWLNRLIACMGGCFGCCSKLPSIFAEDEPSKRIQERLLSDDFWSTSASEVDTTTLNHPDPRGTCCSASNSADFVNHGLVLWNQTRQQWLAGRTSSKRSKDPVMSLNATYESLLGTNNRFSRSVPLSELVDFLDEIWELEGLYDG